MTSIDMGGKENGSDVKSFNNLTKSKSILDFVTSLSEKVDHLKKHHSVICEANVILQLIQNCESLILGVKHIEESILNEAKEMKDRDLQREIDKAHPNLFICLTKFMDSFRDLYRGDTDVREITEVWNDIIKYSEEILINISHILMLLNQARVRRIIKALDAFLDSVEALKFSQPEKMMSNFGGVVDKSVIAYSLIYTRAEDSCRMEKDEIRSYLMQLRKTLPILGAVILKSTQHPNAIDSKVCLRIVLSALEDLLTTLWKDIKTSCSDTKEYQKPGQYSQTLQDIFQTIYGDEEPNRLLPVAGRLTDPVTSLLQYVLSLVHCLAADEAAALMLPSQNLLAELKHLTDIEKNSGMQNSAEVEDSLDNILVVLEDLEIRFNIAFVTFVVSVFAEPYSALDALLRELEGGKEPEEESAQQMSAFEAEVDRLHQVGIFVLSCVSDSAIVAEIKSELRILEWLETGLHASSTRSASEPPHSSLQTSVLDEQWRKCVERLKKHIFGILEPRPILQITKEEIHSIWASATSEASSHDASWLCCKVSRAAALAELLIELHKCRQFLREEQIEQIEQVTEEIKKYERKGEWERCSTRLRSGYIKRLQILLTCISRISETLPESQQTGSSLSESEITVSSSGASSLSRSTLDSQSMFASIFKKELIKARKAKPSQNVRPKRQQNMRTLHNYSEERSTLEASCDLSIDITKFLHSCTKSLTSVHKNSTRSSIPSFTRKLQVVEFDLDDFLKGKPSHKLSKEREKPDFFTLSEYNTQSNEINCHGIVGSATDQKNTIMRNPPFSDATRGSLELPFNNATRGPLELKDDSSMQDAPDSVNISTPERLEDLHTAFQRLTSLKSVFKVNL